MVRKPASIAIALLTATNVSAYSADMLLRKAPLAAGPAPLTWSGVYAGVTLGAVFGSADGYYEGIILPPTMVFYPFDIGLNGVALGGLVGYNVQFGAWVAGLEGDLGWIGGARGRTWDPAGSTRYDDIELRWTGHLRGRLGYAFDRYLVYVAAGLALAGIDAAHLGPTSAGTAVWSASDTRAGYTLGLGLDWSYSATCWIRVEYLYDHFSSKQYDWIAGTRYSVSDLTINTFRLGFIYKPN